MSIGFFHNRLDWINKAIVQNLKKKGIKVDIIDVNNFGLNIHSKTQFKHDLYVNRVYPSENIKSYTNLRFMLEILRHLENLKKPIINSFNSSYIDYSKTEAKNVLEKYGIPTSKALLFSNLESAKKAAKSMKFPKIVKMDCGGKARHVYKANNKKQFLEIVKKISRGHHMIHVEDYYKGKPFTTRLFVLDYKFRSGSKKTLVEGWLGSSCKGAKSSRYYDVPKHVRKIAEKTAKVTKSKILGLDMLETRNSAIVLDINPTPIFSERFCLHRYDAASEIANVIAREYYRVK